MVTDSQTSAQDELSVCDHGSGWEEEDNDEAVEGFFPSSRDIPRRRNQQPRGVTENREEKGS